MTDEQLEIQRLNGELELLTTERNWWAEEMIYWRAKYLADHPEHNNPDYVKSARIDDPMDGQIFL